jgi:acyl-CoA thioester hydrolase
MEAPQSRTPLPHHTLRRRVEFSETDMAGIVHFSNFFRWMEAAEADFFRSLGEPLYGDGADQIHGYPRVRAQCQYSAPVHFEEVIEIRLTVAEITARSIAYRFRFHRTDERGERVAKGEMVTVCARHSATGGLEALPLPASLRRKLEALLV